jgi:hypothetical protein
VSVTSGKRAALGPSAVIGFGVGAGAGFGTVAGFSSAKPALVAITVWMREIPMLVRNARRFMTTPPVKVSGFAFLVSGFWFRILEFSGNMKLET